jgi:transcriptional regulator with XRE-family HTH domain
MRGNMRYRTGMAEIPAERRVPWDYLIWRRRNLGLNRSEFARTAGITVQYLRDLETGRRAGAEGTRKKIADVLGMSVTELDATHPESAARDVA